MQTYQWCLAFHIIAMVAWMAGMFYLPSLYVYHATATKGGELSETLKIMEKRLLRIILNPAMVLTFVFGIALLVQNPDLLKQSYMHAKFVLVLLMTGLHGYLAKLRRVFERDENTKKAVFFRYLNEVPTLLLFGIVILVVLKP